MKKATSLTIGAVLAALAVCFVAYAAGHPEASFHWSNRVTFMLYGAYIWLLLKYLIDIPFLAKKRKEQGRGNLISALGYFCMAVVFFLMEVTGDTVNLFTIIRGFIVVCAIDFGIENIHFWRNRKEAKSEKEGLQ